jgi:hypothetical protein
MIEGHSPGYIICVVVGVSGGGGDGGSSTS